jgi:hypothetical protein
MPFQAFGDSFAVWPKAKRSRWKNSLKTVHLRLQMMSRRQKVWQTQESLKKN